MNLPIGKLTLGRIATIATIGGLLFGWYISYSNKVEQDKKRKEDEKQQEERNAIYQHDQEQRLDSVVNVMSIGTVRFQTLSKSRDESLERTAVHEKEQENEITDLRIKVAVLEKEVDLLYNKKTKP